MTIIITEDGRRRLAEPWTMAEWRSVVERPWTAEALEAHRAARRSAALEECVPYGKSTPMEKRLAAKKRDRYRYNGIRLRGTGEMICPLVGEYPLNDLIAANHLVKMHGELHREAIERLLELAPVVGVRVRDAEPIYRRRETMALVRQGLSGQKSEDTR